MYLSVTNEHNEWKTLKDGTPVIKNNVDRRIVLDNGDPNDYYTFVKAITLAKHNTNEIVQNIYYREDEPARKNFDQAQQCKDQNLPNSFFSACWVYNNWTSNLTKSLVPGDYDVWVHVYYCPGYCEGDTCSMNLGELYDCEKRYHVNIVDNY
ncbi:12320_t:CDS:1 [Funneliformis mosseae]|uniref:12320_t:CDS:1 n=1 Tax=Funneliformis mosseae TaxID=27381 RepID=A0A9N8WJH6_FUNMO|nr:12320_t:CDS:1 [Funneliformis mosseae]